MVVVDTAHNAASVEALLQVLNEADGPSHRVLVFASTQEKDIPGMLHQLMPCFDHTVFTRYRNNPRAIDPDVLLREATHLQFERARCTVASDPHTAWRIAQQITSAESLICITGSFFIAAEMRQLASHYGYAPPMLSRCSDIYRSAKS